MRGNQKEKNQGGGLWLWGVIQDDFLGFVLDLSLGSIGEEDMGMGMNLFQKTPFIVLLLLHEINIFYKRISILTILKGHARFLTFYMCC